MSKLNELLESMKEWDDTLEEGRAEIHARQGMSDVDELMKSAGTIKGMFASALKRHEAPGSPGVKQRISQHIFAARKQVHAAEDALIKAKSMLKGAKDA